MHFRIFDCWRLMAALLIMSYHFLYFAPAGGDVYIAVLHRLLPLLDMFFMISGFLIASRYSNRVSTLSDYGLFLQRRIARLYPLHLATLSFFALVGGAVALGLVETSEPARWDLSMLPLQVLALNAHGLSRTLTFNYPSWSIGAEFFCYALFPLTVLAMRRFGLSGLVALFVAWVAGLELAGWLGAFPDGRWLEADTSGAYRAFADFVLGAIIAAIVVRRPFAVGSQLPGLLALAFAVVAMLSQWNGYLALAGFFAAMLLSALAETARPDATRWLDPLMPLARVSFGIYLIHPVMETLFLSILWKRAVEPTGAVGFYVFWLLPMAATILVAILSERTFEKQAGALLANAGRGSTRRHVAAA